MLKRRTLALLLGIAALTLGSAFLRQRIERQNQLDAELVSAAEDGDAIAARALLRAGARADVQVPRDTGPPVGGARPTLLMLGVALDDVSFVRDAVEGGASVSGSDCDGWTPRFGPVQI